MARVVEADVIPALLTDLKRMNVTIVPTFSLIDEASRIAVTWRRSFYDSVYMALAVVCNGRLVTADEKLCNALRNTSIAGQVVFIGDMV